MNNVKLSDIMDGELSIYSCILYCISNKLDIVLPDSDSIALAFPNLKDKNLQYGEADNTIKVKKDEAAARELFNMFLQIHNECINLSMDNEKMDGYLGRIYTFIISRPILSYIYEFTSLFLNHVENNQNSLDGVRILSVDIFKHFLRDAPHREAVKFAAFMLSVTHQDSETRMLLDTIGHCDEFALPVARAFAYDKDNESIFKLAKFVKGWGRFNYLSYMEIDSIDKREWLIFESYKCDFCQDYVSLIALKYGDVLGYLKENGFDDRIYDAVGDLLDNIYASKYVDFSDYKDSKEVIKLFIDDIINREINDARQYVLVSILNTLDSNLFSDSERELLAPLVQVPLFENLTFDKDNKATIFCRDKSKKYVIERVSNIESKKTKSVKKSGKIKNTKKDSKNYRI
ncbi:hypothetical protein DCO58_11395 [Helicobacter saguini]|uniref:Uncharacterized protein n=1 Tax=Helicobacter saguini TaxID=1548018 RepID=A0A347VQ29_9HELI|nr:hypothetical protein [Helicobacter saguini]MWV61104.1 hypothetical protein [Helicobacter saguini]MWV68227.1 hypothetical protein [Helicobacter saguini]MWV70309.1 hypothetical protein [Helicobacter saguini]MWV72211.1 hypothetical protein [Helicobacter saguini]TLD95263.1 hypothetical protein LS64_002585 [Helicobacter saguini]